MCKFSCLQAALKQLQIVVSSLEIRSYFRQDLLTFWHFSFHSIIWSEMNNNKEFDAILKQSSNITEEQGKQN